MNYTVRKHAPSLRSSFTMIICLRLFDSVSFCMCVSPSVLRWHCEADRMLKSSYKLSFTVSLQVSVFVSASLSLSLYLFPLIVLAQNKHTKENKTKEQQHICWHSASSLCTTDGAFSKIQKSKNGPQNSSIHFQPKWSAQNPEIKQHVCCPVGTAKSATKLYYYPFICCQNNIWLIGLTSHWVCVVDVGTVDTDDLTQIRQLRPCVVVANGHQSVGADLKVGSDGYKSRSSEARDRQTDRDRDRQTDGQRQTDRDRGRQPARKGRTEGQTDRKADRQTETERESDRDKTLNKCPSRTLVNS